MSTQNPQQETQPQSDEVPDFYFAPVVIKPTLKEPEKYVPSLPEIRRALSDPALREYLHQQLGEKAQRKLQLRFTHESLTGDIRENAYHQGCIETLSNLIILGELP